MADFYRRYIECWNERRLTELLGYVADGVLVNGVPHSPAEYVANMDDVFTAFPDFHWELRHLLIDGHQLAAHFTITGTHRGPFLGVPPTGRSFVSQEFAVYRIVDHQITEVCGTADNLGMLGQLTPA
jgi:aspartyl-tRNA synthetase